MFKIFALLEEKAYEICYNPYNTTHLTLGMLLHCSLGKLKIQILCRYSADIEENANNETNYILSAPLVCRLSDEATENIFFSLKNINSVADSGKF